MKKKCLLVLTFIISTVLLAAQTGYDIKIKLKPYKKSWVYLGYYYGKMRALADSAMLDENSTGNFKGRQPLNGGIYFITSPQKVILFETLIDKQQHFSITADSTQLPYGVTFTGSADNLQFQEYSGFAGNTGKKITAVNEQFSKAQTRTDSASLIAQSRIYTDQLQHFRDSIIRRYPSSFLTLLFKAMQEPKIPAAASQPGGKYDSGFAYRFYKEHYWDGISFADDRLVRTPFFESKLEKYYLELVAPNPDSLKKETDMMLLQSRTAKEMYKYLMVYFVQKYINPQFMGQDAVFVHIFEKYVNTGKAEFFTKEYKDYMTKRAYSLMANLIGQPAPDMAMVDTAGTPLPLSAVTASFTVVCFWDPNCSHCKEVVPKVDSIFQAKWKKEGVQVYGVKVDGTHEEWVSFIESKHLNNWLHVYQLPGVQEAEIASGKPGYKQLYDVYQTPLLYLLDKEKRIIAKKLNYLQIDEVINLKLQPQKVN